MSDASTDPENENGASKVAPGYELAQEKSALLERLVALKEEFDHAARCLDAPKAVRVSNEMGELETRVAMIDAKLRQLDQDTPRPFRGPTFP
jgi:hypothetical protein